eukprot:TRINITY_DN3170_c0_g1_i8.p1 TRINITY_DN3170_c0_g1~~TRINITY_DN3170_c0_g1_i8.p1  ORF type:complete len:215 (+),score=29.30 TRINITY_DN3170_c0_g1_i8:1215-1859(+)
MWRLCKTSSTTKRTNASSSSAAPASFSSTPWLKSLPNLLGKARLAAKTFSEIFRWTICATTSSHVRRHKSVGAMDGMISVLETGKPGKDRFTKLVGSMKGASKARCVRWRSSKLEAVVAYESGKVCFWNIQTGQVAYVFDPHILSITKICWDEKNQILYTGSKDKSIKVWRIPGEWNVYYAKKEEKKAEAIKTQEVKQRAVSYTHLTLPTSDLV